MSFQNLGQPDRQASGVAQLGAILGPLIPFLVYVNRRNEESVSARDAAIATNFGMFVLVSFGIATIFRLFVPWIGWVGILAQFAIITAAIILCGQAYASVRTGVIAQYPVTITVIPT